MKNLEQYPIDEDLEVEIDDIDKEENILCWHDGPMIATCRSNNGLLLAYCCDEDYNFIFVPISQVDLENLEKNKLTLRTAITKNNRYWLTDSSFEVFRKVTFNDYLEEDHFPEQGVYLHWD